MFLLLGTLLIIRLLVIVNISFHHWPCGLMDRASVSDTGDCRFKSCQGRSFISVQQSNYMAQIKFCVKNFTMQYRDLCQIQYYVILSTMLQLNDVQLYMNWKYQEKSQVTVISFDYILSFVSTFSCRNYSPFLLRDTKGSGYNLWSVNRTFSRPA